MTREDPESMREIREAVDHALAAGMHPVTIKQWVAWLLTPESLGVALNASKGGDVE